MRLSIDRRDDDERAVAMIREAVERGVSIFDTAHAYRREGTEPGHNERLIAAALAPLPKEVVGNVRVVTKCGMRRAGAAWVPDGRAGTVMEDLAASRKALGDIPIDVLLLHAPDPKVPFAVSLRALARAKEEGLARNVGVANVSLRQLEQAFALAPITAIEVALGAFDDAAARSGVLSTCIERGVVIFAHTPLGGPARAARLARDPCLRKIAERYEATPAEVVIAYLVGLSPTIVPLVGSRRSETLVSSIKGSRIELDCEAMETLDERFPGLGMFRRPAPPPPSGTKREVVLLMGIPGAGKSHAVEAYTARGFERLNRDAIGGSLRSIARQLDERLGSGDRRIVLDNTYVTRLTRSEVVRIAHSHRAKANCIFFDTSVDDAQLNVIGRMLDRYGELLGPEALRDRAKLEPNTILPTTLFRMARDLEPPRQDEGFESVEVIAFVRNKEAESQGRQGAALSYDAITDEGRNVLRDDVEQVLARVPACLPTLVFAWRAGAEAPWLDRARANVERLACATGRTLELAVCPHPSGAPTCWCRPPLPGLWVVFARKHGLDLRGGVFFGHGSGHRTMARTLGMTYETDRDDTPISSVRHLRV